MDYIQKRLNKSDLSRNYIKFHLLLTIIIIITQNYIKRKNSDSSTIKTK